MTNILVTGSNGQLGSEIKELVNGTDGLPSEDSAEEVATFMTIHGEGKPSLPSEDKAEKPLPLAQFFFTDRTTLDITNPHAISEFVEKNNINTIINCAAYTAVDKAESDTENADKINHLAVKYLAQISKDKNIKLIHISTDYVFDGKTHMPYVEDDQTNPNSVYGKTKLDGENAMIRINPSNSIIIRTSWVYSSFGNNFVKTMLRLGKDKDELGVIFDQVGTPTYARDLAKIILDILPQLDSRVKPENDEELKLENEGEVKLENDGEVKPENAVIPDSDRESSVQIYNYSNEGVLSWYDFAKEIMRMAKLDCQINPIETKDYPTPAKRPHFSLINKSKIKKEFNITITYWKDSLDECLNVMGERR